MNSVPTQIFDMLLGNIAPVEQSPQLPSGVEGEGAPLLFGAILGDILNPIQGQAVMPNETGKSIMVDPGQTGVISNNSVTEKSGIGPRTLLDYVTPLTGDEITAPLAIKADSEGLGAETESNILKFNADLKQLLPQADFEFNPAMKELMARKPVELEPGNYIIEKQELLSDKIELTLTGTNGEEPIKLVLPADLLKQSASGTARVDVRAESGADSDNKLRDLLQNLNLKKLEISSIPEEPKTAPDGKQIVRSDSKEPMQVSFVGEESGQTFVIKRKLDRSDLRATRSEKNIAARTELTGKSKGLETVPGIGDPIGKNETVRPVAEPIIGKAGIGTNRMNEFDLSDQSRNFDQGGRSNQSLNSAAMPTDNDFGDVTALSGEKFNLNREMPHQVQPKVARFTIPDDIRTALRPGGNSVTINIEPEHLGQARLNLVLRGDALRAHVIVESVQAKVLVEKSIDQLTDQLSRVDVKVDSIEVSVGERETGNQFFRQSHAWRNQMAGTPNENGNLQATEETVPEMNYAPSRESYLSSSGVDLVA
ncbi:MAG: flagellar hook-length control protein FliK [bacterium]|nr:flagellar hook-length control protein FliK [bacterium]